MVRFGLITRLAVIYMACVCAATGRPQPSQIGTLSCDISGSFGMIITSQKPIACLFTADQPGQLPEVYLGIILRFSLSVDPASGGPMVWSVLKLTSYSFAGLYGIYVSATAEETAATGLDGALLMGGIDRGVALQPLSLPGDLGRNVTAGVTKLRLEPASRSW
jgi:hypothetical protein